MMNVGVYLCRLHLRNWDAVSCRRQREWDFDLRCFIYKLEPASIIISLTILTVEKMIYSKTFQEGRASRSWAFL